MAAPHGLSQALSVAVTATQREGDALAAGDQAGADKYANLAGHISDQMFGNCAVIT
jgi:hypothetical protein